MCSFADTSPAKSKIWVSMRQICSPQSSVDGSGLAQVVFSGVWPTCDVNGQRLTDPKSANMAGNRMNDKCAVTKSRGTWTLGPLEFWVGNFRS